MTYVFDSSFVGALIIPDEKKAYVDGDGLYAGIKNNDEKLVPQLLWYEMRNIFNNLVRHSGPPRPYSRISPKYIKKGDWGTGGH